MAERRKANRVKLLKPVNAKVRTYSPAKVLDLSEKGLLLTLAHPLNPKDRHEVRIQLDGGEVTAYAIVRRCWLTITEAGAPGGRARVYSAGLEFETPQTGLVERLPEESVVHVSLDPEESR